MLVSSSASADCVDSIYGEYVDHPHEWYTLTETSRITGPVYVSNGEFAAWSAAGDFRSAHRGSPSVVAYTTYYNYYSTRTDASGWIQTYSTEVYLDLSARTLRIKRANLGDTGNLPFTCLDDYTLMTASGNARFILSAVGGST